MASDIWLRTILIVRKETRCRHIGYSYRLTARVLLYAPSHRQDNTYHSHCYTSRGALAGTRNSSMGPPHEGSIRRPIAPWANALPLSYVPLPRWVEVCSCSGDGSCPQALPACITRPWHVPTLSDGAYKESLLLMKWVSSGMTAARTPCRFSKLVAQSCNCIGVFDTKFHCNSSLWSVSGQLIYLP